MFSPLLNSFLGPHLIYLMCASYIYHYSATIMEYVAELADKLGKGQGGNLYSGKPEERPSIRSIANAVGIALSGPFPSVFIYVLSF